MKKDTFFVVASYALVYVVWGSTYFFIKAAVGTVPAPFVVSVRFLAGSILLAILARARGGFKSIPPLKELAGAATLGILLLLLGNGLVTVATKTIPSWTASVVIACMPIYVALYNRIIYKAKVSALRMAGAAVGIGGVALILAPGSAAAAALGPGLLIAVAGAMSWGLGSSLARSVPKPADVLVSTSVQMLVAGLVSLAIGLGGGLDLGASLASASAWSLFSIAYLSVLGALALVAYNHLLVVEPSFRVSSYSLVNPLIAVCLGLATGERASKWLAFGSPLVLAGIALMLYGDSIASAWKRRPAGGGKSSN